MTLSLLAGLTSSCGGGGIGSFELQEPIPEQSVEGSALPSALGGFVRFPLEINLEAETEKRDTGPAESVHLIAMSLWITETDEGSGDSDNFDFLDSVEVFVESRKSGSDLPKKKIAEIKNVPMGARNISFDTFDDVNLKPYIEEGARITASGEGSAPEDDTSFAGSATFRVDVL